MTMLDCVRCGGQIPVREGLDQVCMHCGRSPEPATMAEVMERWRVLAEERQEVYDAKHGDTARQGAMGRAYGMLREGRDASYVIARTGLSVPDMGRVRRRVVREVESYPLL